MILPTKHIPEQLTILGIGALVLQQIEAPQTTTSLWDKVNKSDSVGTFERLLLALTFLYTVGLIDQSNGLITRVSA